MCKTTTPREGYNYYIKIVFRSRHLNSDIDREKECTIVIFYNYTSFIQLNLTIEPVTEATSKNVAHISLLH